MRKILHIDMNKFYATVEQMMNPELRGQMVAVCGSVDDRHGIVLTASREAKQMGVKTGMAAWEAKQACPELKIVLPHYDEYLKYSALARKIYARYSDYIEPYGMDESWIDITPIARDFKEAEIIAHEIRRAVKNELGLTVSIGVSFNKVFAKLGSDMKKPDAVTVLSPENWKQRVWPLKADELLYIGSHTYFKLAKYGVFTIGDLASCDIGQVQKWFGKNGIMLWKYANGLDTSRVLPTDYSGIMKSISHGITCTCDLCTMQEVWLVMLNLSQDVARRLRKYRLEACGISLYVRKSDLDCDPGYQYRLNHTTQNAMEIAREAFRLFEQKYAWDQPVRAVTVGVINLVPSGAPSQTELFRSETRIARRNALDSCVDGIRMRFGKYSVTTASLMGDIHMPGDGRHLVQMPGRMAQ